MFTENIDITSRHTFGIKTMAKAWGEYASIDELRNLITEAKMKEWKFMAIGEGSNLLFLKNYEGALLHSQIHTLEVVCEDDSSVVVKAGSGWCWDDFVAHCVTQGWGGLENLSYIPGTVGASAVQNIGAYGVEVCDVISCMTAVDTDNLEEVEIMPADCDYGYRKSRFKGEWRNKYIITSVTYKLLKTNSVQLDYGNLRERAGNNPTLQEVRDAVIAIRREKLPEPCQMGSAGSFFVNPVIPRSHYNTLLEKYPDMPCYEVDSEQVKVPAAWLIESQGWKGKRMGDAQVYEKQCLVIVNCGEAKAGHVVQLANDIAFSVLMAYGIAISPEVNYI